MSTLAEGASTSSPLDSGALPPSPEDAARDDDAASCRVDPFRFIVSSRSSIGPVSWVAVGGRLRRADAYLAGAGGPLPGWFCSGTRLALEEGGGQSRQQFLLGSRRRLAPRTVPALRPRVLQRFLLLTDGLSHRRVDVAELVTGDGHE